MPQVNLHSHSERSFLDGQARIKDIATRAKKCGHEYFALTDHGECNGQMEAAKVAKQLGMGFIPGIEGYWLPEADLIQARTDKVQPSPSHICLLASNEVGLRNLWAVSSLSYTRKHFYHKPISTPELLSEYSEGVYASDGCMLTQFAEAVDQGRDDVARLILGTLLEIYQERFYIELHTWQFMDDSRPEHMALNARMRRLNHAKLQFAQEMSVPFVIVNDSHHANPEDWVNKELVWAFNTSKDNDKLQSKLDVMAQKADHIMGADELVYWMGKHGIAPEVVQQGIDYSYEIAQNCQVELTPTLGMPQMAASEREDLSDLIDACEVGFKRYVTDQGLDEAKYYARLEDELRLIADKKFAGYFNMVRDYTTAYRSGNWSEYVRPGHTKEPILVGPGRGSVGGSLVAYLTGIDIIDPIKYGTLFSRFLSPGRQGLPDVDVDVPQSQRKDMLAYFPRRFGEGNVCVIGTLSRNGPKATLKDLGRALGIAKAPGGWADLEAISEHIEEVVRWQKEMRSDDVDATEDLSWTDLIDKKGGALKPYMTKYPELFSKLEEMTGLCRHSSVHAAGILVSSVPLLGAVPMRTRNHGKPEEVITTQFDMWEIEELGGVKLDLLGIRHLDTLSVARKLIYERHHMWVDYDRTGLSVPEGCDNVLTFGDSQFNDPAIWPQIDNGQTTGIFQVETSTLTEAAVEFKPRSEVDVADLCSIVRPGVADAGLKDVYLRRRAGAEPVSYDHPLMESIVGPGWATDTFGILVYQEQIIEAVQLLGGFTPDEADGLRKAVGKKQMDKVLALKDKFLKGCFANPGFMLSYTEKEALKIASTIWASMEAAGRYSFNWSHAVGYAMISTWEIWTKHYFPQEYLVALMATDSENINKYIREARRRDITILPPDINRSERKFTIEGENIRYGLDTVRGVGKVACRKILKAQPFTSVEDFLKRAEANKTTAYNLIVIGAFDSLASRVDNIKKLERARAMEGLADSTLDSPEKLEKVVTRRLTENPEKWTIPVPDFNDPEVVYALEKELVGTYVTVDPMGRYVKTLDSCALRDPMDMMRYNRKDRFIVGGQLTAINPTTTKKGKNPGQEMAHLQITWNEADFRVVAFPDAWARCKLLLKVGAPIACQVEKLDSGCCLQTVERLDLLFDREGIA